MLKEMRSNINFQFEESSTFLAMPDSSYNRTLIDILGRQIKVSCRIHENFVSAPISHYLNDELLLDNVERPEYSIATEGILGITTPIGHESFIGEPSSKNIDMRRQTAKIEFDALASTSPRKWIQESSNTGMLDEIVGREIMSSNLNSEQLCELEHEHERSMNIRKDRRLEPYI